MYVRLDLALQLAVHTYCTSAWVKKAEGSGLQGPPKIWEAENPARREVLFLSGVISSKDLFCSHPVPHPVPQLSHWRSRVWSPAPEAPPDSTFLCSDLEGVRWACLFIGPAPQHKLSIPNPVLSHYSGSCLSDTRSCPFQHHWAGQIIRVCQCCSSAHLPDTRDLFSVPVFSGRRCGLPWSPL